MHLSYIVDRDHVRVWKHGWPQDRFEVLTRSEFGVLRSVCEKFEISLREKLD